MIAPNPLSFLAVIVLFLASLQPVKDHYAWERLTSAAGFPGSYNFKLFADGDTIRAFHPQGVWASVDGKNWTKTGLPNIIRNQGFLNYVRFNGAVYALGTFEGNIEHYTQTSQIARTSDFSTWEILSKSSNLPHRFFIHPFVFNDKVWIIVGTDDKEMFGDVWNSADGITWTMVVDSLPFGKRQGEQFVVFRNRIIMLDRDAWASSDAIHWERLTPHIAEGEIYGYSPVVFDDMIWLVGCNRSGKFSSDVLVSADGKSWSAMRAPWSPRGGAATCIFRNGIAMTGGKYGGNDPAHPDFVYSNDVWVMRKQ